MSDRLKFIKSVDHARQACHSYIDELRTRIPFVKAIHAELTRLSNTKPTARWVPKLQDAVHCASERPGRVTQFVVTRSTHGMIRGSVSFQVQIDGIESLRFNVHLDSATDRIDPDSALIGYANDEAIADALVAKLPFLPTAVLKYNSLLQQLCEISNFCMDTSLPLVRQNLHPLSQLFQWYELAGDPGKAAELRSRGVPVR